tara:strand:+ start:1462 stop:1656 length:195 start_codon:yes stop_codon:yes gene_type:complete
MNKITSRKYTDENFNLISEYILSVDGIGDVATIKLDSMACMDITALKGKNALKDLIKDFVKELK